MSPRTVTGATFYAGVGSRRTPADACLLMTRIARYLDRTGYTLRSGGAEGADRAFFDGAGRKQIFQPWMYFGNIGSPYYPPKPGAYALVARVHPAWGRLSDAAKALHARNAHQVLGWNLDQPSAFVVCWTKDGATTTGECNPGTGGTGTAIRLATLYNIPVYNLKRGDHRALWEARSRADLAGAGPTSG